MTSLDPTVRDALVRQVFQCLQEAEPDSKLRLFSSLAEGRADEFSDIDLSWEVPASSFLRVTQNLPSLLSRVRPILAIFADPGLESSDRRRLYFVHFDGLPLFWRLDVELLTAPPPGGETYGAGKPPSPSADWPVEHSALLNLVTIIKIALRRGVANAEDALRNEFSRLGIPLPAGGFSDQLTALADAVVSRSTPVAALALRVRELCQHVSHHLRRAAAAHPKPSD